jgi:nucleotide-binding universal stress UspA family protein
VNFDILDLSTIERRKTDFGRCSYELLGSWQEFPILDTVLDGFGLFPRQEQFRRILCQSSFGWPPGSAFSLVSNRRIMSQTENLGQIGQTVPDTASRNFSPALITHILAPTDLSDESRRTLNYAVRLAEHFHAQLMLLHVWTPPRSHAGVLGALDPEAIQRSKDRAESILRRLQDIIRERYSDTESYFLTGEPCAQIVAVAKGSEVDLIVISTHDYDWLTRAVEGSDAEKILHDATCPVWIVREKEFIAKP